MVNPSVFDHLRPFWAHLDSFGPFQTKINFLLWGTSAKPYFVHLGQKKNFCLNWSKRVQMGPKRLVQWHNVKLQIREICKMQQSRDRLQVDLSAPLPSHPPRRHNRKVEPVSGSFAKGNDLLVQISHQDFRTMFEKYGASTQQS